MTREEKIELLAKNICKMVAIEPIDSLDGSPNWWMFTADAEKLVSDLEGRNFQVLNYFNIKEEGDKE